MRKFAAGFVAGVVWAFGTPHGARLAEFIFNQQIERFNARKWPYHRVEERGADKADYTGRDWSIF
jgi:hypothetical protein